MKNLSVTYDCSLSIDGLAVLARAGEKRRLHRLVAVVVAIEAAAHRLRPVVVVVVARLLAGLELVVAAAAAARSTIIGRTDRATERATDRPSDAQSSCSDLFSELQSSVGMERSAFINERSQPCEAYFAALANWS